MWAHQYEQQVNQVECSVREDRPWSTNGPGSDVIGLEPRWRAPGRYTPVRYGSGGRPRT